MFAIKLEGLTTVLGRDCIGKVLATFILIYSYDTYQYTMPALWQSHLSKNIQYSLGDDTEPESKTLACV